MRVADEGWDYRCDGVHASTMDRRERLEAEPYLEGEKAVMRAAAGDAGRFGRKRDVVGGHEAEILFLSALNGTVIATAAVVPLPEGTRSVDVDCIGASPERCRQVLDALAGCPWRSGPPGGAVIVSEAEFRLAGRVPSVPEGCTGRPGTSGGQIDDHAPGAYGCRPGVGGYLETQNRCSASSTTTAPLVSAYSGYSRLPTAR